MRSTVTLATLFFLACALGVNSSTAHAQEHAYTSPKGDYVVDFPSPVWRVTDEPDDVHQYTEFIADDFSRVTT